MLTKKLSNATSSNALKIIPASILLSVMAGCATVQKPELMFTSPVIMSDGGICLNYEDTKRLAEYVQGVEAM